jgi:hypothetical protein
VTSSGEKMTPAPHCTVLRTPPAMLSGYSASRSLSDLSRLASESSRRANFVQHVHTQSIFSTSTNEISQWYYNTITTTTSATRNTTQRNPTTLRAACLPIQRDVHPQANQTASPLDKIHVLGARCVEALLPCGKVKFRRAAGAAIVRESQILVKVESGTRTDDLIFCSKNEG